MNYAQKSLFLLTGNVPRVLSFKGGVGVMSDEFYPSFPIESDFFFFFSFTVLFSDSQMS